MIDIESFIEARKIELQHFMNVLSMKSAVGGSMGTKLSFQKLPKHMRRRAMSHNIHRMPKRLHHRSVTRHLGTL